MMTSEGSYFKVLYKRLTDAQQSTTDYLVDSLSELHKQLKADDITIANCQFLYVHQWTTDGVNEVVAYEKEKTNGLNTALVPIKPRVTFRSTPAPAAVKGDQPEEKKRISSMLYYAEVA